MNTPRLVETIEQLQQAERAVGFQSILVEVSNQLLNLVNQPQHPSVQTSFAEAMGRLKVASDQMQAKFEPAQVKRFEEVGAAPFFMADLPADISRLVAENPVTPAVAQQKVAEIQSDRQLYLTTINEIKERLSRIGIVANQMTPGDAEVGFTIPRDLFDNNLDGLIGELREIRFILRIFSEVSTATVVMLGKAAHWILDTWKKVEDIRKVPAETKKLGMESEAALLAMFDANIKATIDAAIQAKVNEMLGSAQALTDGRTKELEAHMVHALESLFARIERAWQKCRPLNAAWRLTLGYTTGLLPYGPMGCSYSRTAPPVGVDSGTQNSFSFQWFRGVPDGLERSFLERS
eukprot:gene2742-2781_t